MSKGIGLQYALDNFDKHINNVDLSSSRVVVGIPYDIKTRNGEIITKIPEYLILDDNSQFKNIKTTFNKNGYKYPLPRYVKNKMFPKPLRNSLNLLFKGRKIPSSIKCVPEYLQKVGELKEEKLLKIQENYSKSKL